MADNIQMNEDQHLIQGLAEEGLEMLDEVEPMLIELEKISDQYGEVDVEVIDTIFRFFHSLKGSAGFLDLHTLSKVTHVAETLLDLFRKGRATFESDHIDLLNRSCDFIRLLLDKIYTEFDDSGHEDEAKVVIQDIEKTISLIEKDNGENETPVIDLDFSDESEPISEEANLEQSVESPLEPAEKSDELQLTISEDLIKQYLEESQELIESAEQGLLELEKDPSSEEAISQSFRSLHSFKGNSGFMGYSDLEKLSHQAETLLDLVRCKKVGAVPKVFSLLLEVLDFLRVGLSQVAENKPPRIPAINGLISLISDARTTCQLEQADSEDSSPPIAEIQPETKSIPEKNKKPKTAVKKPEGKTHKTAVPPAHKKAEDKREGERRQNVERRSAERATHQRQSLRVDVEKMDLLLDMMGELVIAQAMVAQSPDLKGLNVPLEKFEKSILHLEKIIRDLQDVGTSIRMIQLSSTFRRMIRLVRDLSQKAGKKVELELIGEETEVDKTIIEHINDPLVHAIRNSLDHGIGTPEERIAVGKPPTGKVTLTAKYVGGEVWIIIQDDGMGLNREKIVERIIERGLYKGDCSELSDDEVWQFIFEAGFSTAEKVTDISGRGVGMDVVRRNIESIRGKVDVRSQTGKGTEIILRIPLTLATIDGMIVRVGESLYTIPILSIKESLQVNLDQVTRTMDNQEIVKIRDNLFPVVRLGEFFGVNSDQQALNEGITMVVESDDKTICLFVDDLIGQQQVVIKGISSYIGNLNGISGCTILGDGNVCPIIDVAGIIELAQDKIQDSSESC